MTNINEALAKRKTHYFIDEWTRAPLCGISLETMTYKEVGLFCTRHNSEVTCKRCIRSLTGSSRYR